MSCPSHSLFHNQQGRAPVWIILAAVVLGVLGYLYLRETGTADNAAAAISNSAQQLGNEAAAEYHELRAENAAQGAAEAASTSTIIDLSADAMHHQMQENEARAAADAHEATARENAAVVSQQVSSSLNEVGQAARTAADEALQPATTTP